MKPLIDISYTEIIPGNKMLADIISGKIQIGEAEKTCYMPDRSEISAALIEYNTKIGADEIAIANAHKIATCSTKIISAGQQPGLLCGPVYTLYKAITAIGIADNLSANGDEAVAIFWLASDDDDRDETDHISCWDKTFRQYELKANWDDVAKWTPVGNLPIQQIFEVIEDFARITEDIEIAEWMREIANKSEDFGDFNARMLSNLFSKYGLVICDSRLPAMRKLAVPAMEREIDFPLVSTGYVHASFTEYKNAGYNPPLDKPADLCNFFLMIDGTRRKVRYHEGKFIVNNYKELTADEMREILADSPELFIPNAALRPIVQEMIFCSYIFVAGPSEITYWAELTGIFAFFETPMPKLCTRSGATVYPQEIAAGFAAMGLNYYSPVGLLDGEKDIIDTWARTALHEGDEDLFSEAEYNLMTLGNDITRACGAHDPTLINTAKAMQKKWLNELDRVKDKVMKAARRSIEVKMERFRKLREVVYPAGNLQERNISVVTFISKFGVILIPRLLRIFDGKNGRHYLIEE